MLYTSVFTSLIVALYSAQRTSLQLGHCIALRTYIYKSLIVTLCLAQRTSLQLGLAFAIHVSL